MTWRQKLANWITNGDYADAKIAQARAEFFASEYHKHQDLILELGSKIDDFFELEFEE